ncbi:spermidine synthase [Paraburkholderia monticola]|uniref:Spermidine synthase n=1 Tax=Paraburkholderia monticola TaxID=1399968 RepID=A0A149PKM7_9BURK|nr:fused MFS/spermidine synthase [Paraburkholderia monticola]KXU85590.1 spermidine synthase [Paraburkholderia monticola]
MDGDRTSLDAFREFLSTTPSEERPFVLETQHGLSLHFDHFSTQSFMSLTAPDRLALPYTRTMMGFLLLQSDPRHICMIGLGGGSLAKYCYRHLPQARTTAVEINPQVIALRDVFRIPADDTRFEVICADGAEYIHRAGMLTDVILLDAYQEKGMPDQCTSADFFAACRARLTDSGVLVVNLMADDPVLPSHVERLASAFGTSYSVVRCRDVGNYVAFAWKGARRLPARRELYERARAPVWDGAPELLSTARGLKDGECLDWQRFIWRDQEQGYWKIGV